MLTRRSRGEFSAAARRDGSIRRQITTLSALFVAAALAILAMAASAGAETSGQIGEPWGGPGTGSAQFFNPGAFGVDPSDGSVYTVDVTENLQKYRIQKLTEGGEFKASAEVARFVEPEKLAALHGIAVDHGEGRFYLIEGCRVNTISAACRKLGSLFSARQILVFKTEPEGAKLVSAGTLTLPTGTEQLYNPKSIAVDPSTHDLVILAENAEGHPVVQRFSKTGASLARFVDSSNVLKPTLSRFAPGVVVSPTGVSYAVTGGESGSPGAEFTRAWELPSNLSSVSAVSGFAEAAKREGWTNGLINAYPALLGGPQLAISADGKTLYWKESIAPSTESEAGSVAVRGYSLSESATTVLYGGAEEVGRCEIFTGSSTIGALGSNLIVLDNGPEVEAGKTPPYGPRVLTFGPGGTSCPGPTAAFSINESKEAEVTVGQEETVSFDAKESVLGANSLAELVWDFGDGTIEKVQGEPPKTTITHSYSVAGDYTVKLRLRVKNPNVSPQTVQKMVHVTGEEVSGPFCSGSQAIGVGSWEQRNLQRNVWIPGFASDVCPGGPAVGYSPELLPSGGSIEAMKEWNHDGARGSINTSFAFLGTDEAPTQAQLENVAGVAGGAHVAVIPVAQTSIAIVANPPAGCTVQEITNTDLQKVFRGVSKTWSALETATGTCGDPITRVLRGDPTGTTAALKNYLSRINSSVLTCTAGRTWKDLRPTSETGSGAPNTTWPESCGEQSLSPVVRSARGDKLVEKLKETPGGIGYATLREAHASGAPAILRLQNNGQGNAATATFAKPAVAGGQANCAAVPYTVPTDGRRVAGASGLDVDWSGVMGTVPAIGGATYPLCTLAYDLAFHGYKAAGFGYKRFQTVHDFLREYVVQPAGQAAIEASSTAYFAPLPSSSKAANDVLGAAQLAANKISW
jgi:ABC-type phosphate transport system substrate-binding protein